MTEDIRWYQKEIERAQGAKEQIEKDLASLDRDFSALTVKLEDTESAQMIIQYVAQKTQEEIQYHLSEFVSMALESIFGEEAYNFITEFTSKGSRAARTECRFLFEKNGSTINPLLAAGGGPIDVAAFGLKITIWTIAQPKTRNTIVLDEPFKYLSAGLIGFAGDMLKEISDKLNVQFIIVSHSRELINSADKIFIVEQKNDISNIRIKQNRIAAPIADYPRTPIKKKKSKRTKF